MKQLRNIRIMEICGTHTHAIAKLGIKNLLSPNIELISGPGCPVCVSEEAYIDACLSLLEHPNVTIATFGDMLNVRGEKGSLAQKKTEGKSVKVIYSPEDAIELARQNKEQDIVFAAVGFETTAPLIACVAKRAKELGIENLFFLTALKKMESIIHWMMNKKIVQVDGIICPGHVAAITGIKPFELITKQYGIPAVICGFEASDIISGIHMLVEQVSGKKRVQFVNNYTRCVNPNGNVVAIQMIEEVFEVSDTVWRGIGGVGNSALVLRNEYAQWDATKRWNIQELKNNTQGECECRDILLGIKAPNACTNFGTKCTPKHPLGPCMISGEGACAAYYHYNRAY